MFVKRVLKDPSLLFHYVFELLSISHAVSMSSCC